jgi:pentatricopeptide repeat protein
MKSRGIAVGRLVAKGTGILEGPSTRAYCRILQNPQRRARASSSLLRKSVDVRFASSTHHDDDGNPDKTPASYYDEIPEDDDVDDMAYETFDDDESLDEAGKFNEARKEKDRHTEEAHKRIWLDPSTKLEDRVNKFLNRRLGTMHPLDIKLASVDLIRECGKMNSFEGMKYAHDILDRILEEKRYAHQSDNNNRSLVFLSERPFQVLMYGWANLCQSVPLAPKRMREVLDLMIQETEYDERIKREFKSTFKLDDEAFANLPSCEPTVDIFHTLLQGLVQASFRSIAAASESEKVLSAMIGKNRKRGWHTKPNTKSFTLAMTAFSKTRHGSAGDRAEAILRRMVEYHEQEKELYYEETGMEYDLHDPSSNKRRIVTPDTVAFSVVIQAHAQSDAEGSADKALALLSELLESNDPAMAPDAFVFANTINAFARMASKKQSGKARMQAAERAEYIVWLMVDELKHAQNSKDETLESEEKNTSDDEESTSHTIASRPGVSTEKLAGDRLANVIPFNACLNAWAQSNTSKSATRAEELLHKMLDPNFSQATGIVPNTTSFNTCMQAWAKAARDNPQAPEKAEELLTLLASLDDATASNIKPDVTSYTTVMTAYAKSNRADKAVQARRLMDSLLSSKNTAITGKITAVPFTVLLNAVAHSPNPREINDDQSVFATGDDLLETDDDPYTIALGAYLELQEDLHSLRVHADHLAYATMLDVVAKHTEVESIERRQRIERVWEDARASGQVSSSVVTSLMRASPNQDMLQTLLRIPDPTSISSINALPREWTRHVPPRFRKLRDASAYNNRKKKDGRGRKSNQKTKNRKEA